MAQILEEHADLRRALALGHAFVHVGIPGQPLHIGIAADVDEFFASLVGRIPEPLHDAEHEETPCRVRFMKTFSGKCAQGFACIATRQKIAGRDLRDFMRPPTMA